MEQEMKFWQLLSIFRGKESLLYTTLKDTEYQNWMDKIDGIIDQQDRCTLDCQIPTIICENALANHTGVLYLYSDDHIRSYEINEAEWRKAGNTPITFEKISYINIFRKYGGRIIEEALECGSVSIKE